MSNETQPTSEWEHSHALEAGDELVTDDGTTGRVKYVRDDGSACIAWTDGEQDHDEDELRRALANSEFQRTDGKSHELASF